MRSRNLIISNSGIYNMNQPVNKSVGAKRKLETKSVRCVHNGLMLLPIRVLVRKQWELTSSITYVLITTGLFFKRYRIIAFLSQVAMTLLLDKLKEY